jgi:GT2 family glycosyltransferase
MRPGVAIIIVNWNSYEMTSQCLVSLRSLEYPYFKTVVVDNGSTDGSADRLQIEFPEIILLKNQENRGFTGGNNSGIIYAIQNNFEYLMLLNNDTIITPSFLTSLIKRIDSTLSIGAIQPKIMYNYDRSVIWNAGTALNKFLFTFKTIGENEKDKGLYDKAGEIPWITGCCFLVRTDIIKEIGPLDDKFFIYYEDVDWSLKIRNHSHKLWYEPKAVIYHEAGMSDTNRANHNEGKMSPFSHYMNVRNHLYIVRRHAYGINRLGGFLYQLAKFFGYTGYFLVRGRFKKMRSVWRVFSHGLLK